MDLTVNEKRILTVLAKKSPRTATELAVELKTTPESVVQWAHLCAERGLITVEKKVCETAVLTPEGKVYAEQGGLPERMILARINPSISMKELTRDPLAKIAIGWLRKKNWITIENGMVTVNTNAINIIGKDEEALKNPVAGTDGCNALIKRGLATIHEDISWILSITLDGKTLVDTGLDIREEVGTLTREQIVSGDWKNLSLRKYNIFKLPDLSRYDGIIIDYNSFQTSKTHLCRKNTSKPADS